MTNPTISEIQDYIKATQRTEDSIPTKAKDRITRAVAEGIKGVKELPKGQCNTCGRHSDKLIPISMKVCLACANKFISRGNGVKFLKTLMEDYHCDNCFTRTFKTVHINPYICEYCAKRVSKQYQSTKSDVMSERRRIKTQKRKIMGGI